jgi:hypothetical protein
VHMSNQHQNESAVCRVRADLQAAIGLESPVPLNVALTYDRRDPFAIHAEFGTTPSVSWFFARDLLIDALTTGLSVSGTGDVQLWSDEEWIVVVLNSPEGHAEIRLPRDGVALFASQSQSLVRQGEEESLLDWDHLLAQICP